MGVLTKLVGGQDNRRVPSFVPWYRLGLDKKREEAREQLAALDDSPPEYKPGEDPYAGLREYDVEFLIDDSWSMKGPCWWEAGEAVAEVAPIATQYDADGVGVHFVNDCSGGEQKPARDAGEVQARFDGVKFGGATDVGRRLREILFPYTQDLYSRSDGGRWLLPPGVLKPRVVVVITDGGFTDDVASVLVDIGTLLNEVRAPGNQLGIQFFQVGNNRDAEFSLSELDKGIKDGEGKLIRDFVDTVHRGKSRGKRLTADYILKVLLGAVERRRDGQSVVQGVNVS